MHKRVGKARYRWEFQLAPGETDDDFHDRSSSR
jgi:hypothetical protein